MPHNTKFTAYITLPDAEYLVGHNSPWYGHRQVRFSSIRECFYNGTEYRMIFYKFEPLLWISEKNKEFEKQFPEFPYMGNFNNVKYYTTMYKLNDIIDANIANTELIMSMQGQITELTNQVAALTSHLETLLVGLNERLPTSDPID
jgi:hypothetical protein